MRPTLGAIPGRQAGGGTARTNETMMHVGRGQFRANCMATAEFKMLEMRQASIALYSRTIVVIYLYDGFITCPAPSFHQMYINAGRTHSTCQRTTHNLTSMKPNNDQLHFKSIMSFFPRPLFHPSSLQCLENDFSKNQSLNAIRFPDESHIHCFFLVVVTVYSSPFNVHLKYEKKVQNATTYKCTRGSSFDVMSDLHGKQTVYMHFIIFTSTPL
jgi:hypothetical protein